MRGVVMYGCVWAVETMLGAVRWLVGAWAVLSVCRCSCVGCVAGVTVWLFAVCSASPFCLWPPRMLCARYAVLLCRCNAEVS